MTQAEQIYEKHIKFKFADGHKNPIIIAAIQEALDSKEKEKEQIEVQLFKEQLSHAKEWASQQHKIVCLEKELQELREGISDAMYYSAQCARDCTVYDRECNFVETDEKALNKKLDDYYTKTFTNDKI